MKNMIRGRGLLQVLAFAVCLGVMLSLGQQTTQAAKKVVAVMPLENVSGYDEHRVAEMMTEYIAVAVQQSGTYQVVERTQLSRAMGEIAFQQTGMVDSDSAVQVGKMVGADYSIVGKIISASVGSNSSKDVVDRVTDNLGLGHLNRMFGSAQKRYRGHIALDYRVIDNATGLVVFAKSVEGHKTGGSPEAAMQAACQEATKDIDEQVRELNPFAAKVIEVDGDTIYINQGANAGVMVGDRLKLVSERPLLDDGRVLGVRETKVAEARVVEVHDGYAVCEVKDKTGVVRNGIVAKRK